MVCSYQEESKSATIRHNPRSRINMKANPIHSTLGVLCAITNGRWHEITVYSHLGGFFFLLLDNTTLKDLMFMKIK